MDILNPAFDYDKYGHEYSGYRRTDPRIAEYVHRALGDAKTVLNVGAGAGSYEPADRYVVAVEPSRVMREQRLARGKAPAVIGRADSLPFDDQAFDASMAMITVHHWPDIRRGLAELRRVTRDTAVVMTFDPAALEGIWLAHYFPELIEIERIRMPALFALLTVPAGMLLALALAALTHTRLPGKRLFQFAFSLPLVLSVGSAAVIWKFLFHPTLGMLNYLLGLAGVSPVQWLVSPDWALVSIALMTVWMNLGFNYIILSSGMQGIPDELYESATIDGAGPITVFRKITLPLLSPTLFFLLVVSIISAFQSFGQINILTMGGPMNRTNVFVYTIYQEAFVNFRFGTGSAQALLLFLVIMLLTLIQFKWVERKVHYQ